MTEQQAAEPQAGEEQAQEAASQNGARAQEAAPEQDTQAPQTVDDLPKWARDELRKTRNEAARLRTQQKQREDAEKTELQQATERAQELTDSLSGVTTELREYRFSDAIQLPNKEYAWLAARRYGIEVEFDDKNRPTNADKVAKALAQRDPKLFGAGNADAGEKGDPPKADGPAESLAGILLGGR